MLIRGWIPLKVWFWNPLSKLSKSSRRKYMLKTRGRYGSKSSTEADPGGWKGKLVCADEHEITLYLGRRKLLL